MHCNQEQIEALLDGELTGPEGDAVLAHLRDCPGCRSYYRQLLAMEQALRADTDPVPEDLLADIMSRVHDTPQRRRRQPWLRATMGMAACLVVVLGIYLVHQQAEKGGDSPFSGILTDSSANNSVGADEDTFTDEVVPSDGGLTFASGGAEEQESSGPADYVLTGPAGPPVAVPAGTGAGRGRRLSPHCPAGTGAERRRAGAGTSHG